MTATAAQAKGLEGVIIADTRLSKVDGQAGRLTYCGYDIMDLARHATFEEVVYLLWNLKLPNKDELAAFKARLFAEMALPPELLAQMKGYPKNTHPMAALRSAISVIGMFDLQAEDASVAANKRKALSLTAKTPTVIAAWARIRAGEEPLSPRADLSLAGNFVYMMTGADPDPTATDAIDKYLILLADHGMNASTFTARVVTSTDGDMYSAITAAIGALKGPKHGGANEAAMHMFMEVDESGLSVADWFKAARANGRRLMGIGHRVYKAPDPRATVLRESSQALAASTGEGKWFDIAYQLEQAARADEYFIERDLYANVDYYSAVALYLVGVPVDMFTPLFAMSRMAGWTANIIEQWADNRLIRPKANYVGEMGLAWLPLEERA